MNPELQQLETELKQLQPASPPPGLKDSIAARLEQPGNQSETSGTRRILPFAPIFIGMAASLALVLGIHWYVQEPSAPPAHQANQAPETATASASSIYEPIHAEQQLTDAFEDGVFLNDKNQPVRKYRYQFVDSVTLKNRNDGALYNMMVPREEIVLVPVSLL